MPSCQVAHQASSGGHMASPSAPLGLNLHREGLAVTDDPDDPSSAASCPFCPVALAASTASADTVLASGPRVNLLPTVGMLVRGYLLACTDEHFLSMADLGVRRLADLDVWLRSVRAVLTPLFGRYLTFEHGSSMADRKGACIEHAHVHLIPMADDLSGRLRDAAHWHSLDNFSDLAGYRGRSYGYLQLEDTHLVLAEPGLGSQWIRREVAAILERDDWDWGLHGDEQPLKETLYRLDGLGPLDAAIDAAMGGPPGRNRPVPRS